MSEGIERETLEAIANTLADSLHVPPTRRFLQQVEQLVTRRLQKLAEDEAAYRKRARLRRRHAASRCDGFVSQKPGSPLDRATQSVLVTTCRGDGLRNTPARGSRRPPRWSWWSS